MNIARKIKCIVSRIESKAYTMNATNAPKRRKRSQLAQQCIQLTKANIPNFPTAQPNVVNAPTSPNTANITRLMKCEPVYVHTQMSTHPLSLLSIVVTKLLLLGAIVWVSPLLKPRHYLGDCCYEW